jgi:hypothetical protein
MRCLKKNLFLIGIILFISLIGIVNAAIYDGGGFYIHPENIVLKMHFDNQSSRGENNTYVYDYSGNNNNGTVIGAICNQTFGKIGGSFYFNGTTDYIQILNSLSLNLTKGYTISLWSYREYTAPNQFLFSKSNATSRGLNMLFEPSVAGLGSYAGNGTYIASGLATGNSVWKQTIIKVSSDGTVMVGCLDKTCGIDKAYAESTSNDLNVYLGSRDGTTEYFKGFIDEVVVWNTTLTGREINLTYDHYTGACGYSPFDGCNISTSTTFDTGTYYLNGSSVGAIQIKSGGLTLDCNGSTIVGNNTANLWGIVSTNFLNIIIIKNCNIINISFPIKLEYASGTQLINDTFKNYDRCRLIGSSNSKVINNSFYNSGSTAAIWFSTDSGYVPNNNNFTGNYFENGSGTLIYVGDGSGNQVINNIFNKTSGRAVRFQNQGNNKVINNTMINIGTPAIYNQNTNVGDDYENNNYFNSTAVELSNVNNTIILNDILNYTPATIYILKGFNITVNNYTDYNTLYNATSGVKVSGISNVSFLNLNPTYDFLDNITARILIRNATNYNLTITNTDVVYVRQEPECYNIPEPYCSISRTTTFDTGTYYLNGDATKVINITNSNIIINGNGSTFIGNNSGWYFRSVNFMNNVTFQNFNFINMSFPLALEYGNGNKIYNSNFTNIDRIRMLGSYNGQFINNSVKNMANYGLYLEYESSTCDNWLVSNDYFENSSINFIKSGGCTNTTIQNTVFNISADSAIWFDYYSISPHWTTNVKVTNCSFYNFSDNAIDNVESSSGNIYNNNNFYNAANGKYGLKLVNQLNSNSSGNYYDNSRAIYFNNVWNYLDKNSQIYNETGYVFDIIINNTNITIDGAIMQNLDGYGSGEYGNIEITGTSNRNILFNNLTANNVFRPIYMHNTGFVTIDNSSFNNTDTAIMMHYVVNDVTIKNTNINYTIRGDDYYNNGICGMDRVYNITIDNVNIDNYANIGMFFMRSGNITIKNTYIDAMPLSEVIANSAPGCDYDPKQAIGLQATMSTWKQSGAVNGTTDNYTNTIAGQNNSNIVIQNVTFGDNVQTKLFIQGDVYNLTMDNSLGDYWIYSFGIPGFYNNNTLYMSNNFDNLTLTNCVGTQLTNTLRYGYDGTIYGGVNISKNYAWHTSYKSDSRFNPITFFGIINNWTIFDEPNNTFLYTPYIQSRNNYNVTIVPGQTYKLMDYNCFVPYREQIVTANGNTCRGNFNLNGSNFFVNSPSFLNINNTNLSAQKIFIQDGAKVYIPDGSKIIGGII